MTNSDRMNIIKWADSVTTMTNVVNTYANLDGVDMEFNNGCLIITTPVESDEERQHLLMLSEMPGGGHMLIDAKGRLVQKIKISSMQRPADPLWEQFLDISDRDAVMRVSEAIRTRDATQREILNDWLMMLVANNAIMTLINRGYLRITGWDADSGVLYERTSKPYITGGAS